METLFELAQGELLRANADKRHPFRFFTLATLDQYPEVRTVVLRKASPDFKIVVFTDPRSPKIHHIQANAHVSALFYHTKKRLQIRIRAKAILPEASSDEFAQYVQQVKSSFSVSDYTSELAPGAVLDENEVAATEEKLFFQPIILKPQTIDVLRLSREGHQRIQYWQEDGRWKEARLVP